MGYLTVEQVAKDLGFRERTIHKWIKEGRIAALKVGREYRISEQAYEDFKRRNEIAVKEV